jgi:hypothetical protein
MWKMPNFRRLGLFKYINCQGPRPASPKGQCDLRFEIRGTFSEGASSPRFPVTGRLLVVYILLNFVKFLKK